MPTTRMVRVASPSVGPRERAYVLEALDAGEVSSMGAFVRRFERAFADYIGVPFAIATANGTVALHLTLEALGLKAGDEVLVPDLTFVATANAVAYTGAVPVPVDVDPFYWTLDPDALAARLTRRTRGIMPVHLYGHPVDMDPVRAFARQHGLWVLEDAAEAHGAEYRGARTGSLGDAGIFSFYGNKIITTGEGGMVVMRDQQLWERCVLLKNHGMDPTRRYWHPVRGYNYRMTNLQAALGLAQLEQIDDFLAARRSLASLYNERLSGIEGLMLPVEAEWARHAYWMYSVVAADTALRDRLMQRLSDVGVETRPFFYPFHVLPMYRASDSFPISERLAACGINLPTGGHVTPEDVACVAEVIRATIATG